jgi:hypothetical protein
MDFVGSTGHHRNRIGARALIVESPPAIDPMWPFSARGIRSAARYVLILARRKS